MNEEKPRFPLNFSCFHMYVRRAGLLDNACAASVHRIATKLGTLVEERITAQLCNCNIVPLKCVVFPRDLDNTPVVLD